MATISLPNGESIWYADSGTNYSAATISSTEASYLAALMNRRERFDFEWANSTERTAQTGMVQGSRGYQIDTKTEYIYDNSQWRLALPWAEFTASISVGDTAPAGPQPIGTLTLDATQSTDGAFVTPGASGVLTLVRAGIYLVASSTDFTNPITGRTFVEVATPGVNLQRVSVNTSETLGSLSCPLRTAAANTNITFNYYKQTGGTSTVATRIRVARIG